MMLSSTGKQGGQRPSAQKAAVSIPEWFVLAELIAAHQPLPEGSLIVGVEQDGKPLVLSLDDPSLGSILIMGDRQEANRKHLGAVLASAERLNSPEILQIDVITPAPEAFTSKSSTLRQVCPVEDDSVFALLGDTLTNLGTRLRDRRSLPYQLLVLDQIDALTGRLTAESLRFLRWIMRRGPQVGVWPIASIASEGLETFDRKTFRAFGFRMCGKMTEPRIVSRFTEISPDLLKALSPGAQGCYKLEEQVVSFSIPEVA